VADLGVGDIVIRSHRLLKTRGTVVRVAAQRRGEVRQVWVKWEHPHTLPNPSLESADTLERVAAARGGGEGDGRRAGKVVK
jgi:hypothetical protein